MDRSKPLGFRIRDDIKAALERAAGDDSRSMSSLIVKVLTDWLIEHGYHKRKSTTEER
jgi:hypothetical protein